MKKNVYKTSIEYLIKKRAKFQKTQKKINIKYYFSRFYPPKLILKKPLLN